MDLPVVVVGFIVFALGWRLVADRLDRARIAGYFEARGERVESIAWSPFGRGWFGEKGDRIYQVCYRDRAGTARTVWCKTSLLSGVYVSESTDARP